MNATEAEVDTKLAACPFCGGVAEIVDAEEAGPDARVVCCTGCAASSKVIFALKEDVTELLVEAWNRRPALSTLQVQTSEAVAWRTDIFESLPNGKLTRLILDASEVKNPDPDWTPLYTRSPQ